jgi:hypothetical protein
MLTLAPALTALAATLAVSTTPSAPAQYPIGVTRCDVVASTPALPFDAMSSPAVNTLEVSFVNHAAIVAKDVRITVSFEGSTQTIDDRGTFSPNIAIDHSFGPTATYGGGAAQCSVASVQFADGTSWQPQV